jgi:hypothetical protein
MKSEGKKIRPIRYGPFKILENIGTNAFHLDLPAYMEMHSMVNFENLKPCEPPMIMDEDESIQVPTIDDFYPDYLEELQEDIIFDRRIRTSQRGDVEYLRVGIKGVKPNNSKWMYIGRVREPYPHLVGEYTFGGPKAFQWGGMIQEDIGILIEVQEDPKHPQRSRMVQK